MTEGYKKKDIQSKRQKIDGTISISSKPMASADDNHSLKLGTVEKLTMVTTGTLAVSVTPMIADKIANSAIAVTGTPSTTVLSNMAAGVKIVYTSGTGTLTILGK